MLSVTSPKWRDNLDAIAAVEGIDGLFVGPTDLSLALGLPPSPKWRDENAEEVVEMRTRKCPK